MRTLGKTTLALMILLLGIFMSTHHQVCSQGAPDPGQTGKLSKEELRKLSKAKRDSVYRVKKQQASGPRMQWSDEFTGKEIQHLIMELKSEQELRLLRDLGITCCSGLGRCECEVTLEQMAEIKTHRIEYRRITEDQLQEREERWERMTRRVDRAKLGPNDVILASLQVNSGDELKFLSSIGMDCCVDTGICKCQITKEQWKQIGFYGFKGGVQVRDTTEWGRETKPKSDKIIPPKILPEGR